MSKRKIVLIHIACWGTYISYALFMNYLTFLASFNFKDLLISHLMAVTLFYCFVFIVIPRLMLLKKSIIGLSYFILILLVYCCLRYISKFGLSGEHIILNPFDSFLKRPFVYFCVFVYFEYFIYALGYWFAMESVRKSNSIKELERNQMEVENQFLREQISPHFLYNSLSYFYGKTLAYDAELAEGIVVLTDILRYSLKGDGAKVPLQEEVENIENLFKISNLRFNNQIKVIFHTSGILENSMVIPHAYITLVENALKYGDVHDENHPIRIFLIVEGSKFKFVIKNRKMTGANNKPSGTGLRNLKRRLDLAYNQNYELKLENEPDFYTATLEINDINL